MDDAWRLERFVAAQDQGGTYQRAVAELRAGAKASHWMWFVFPQIAGLGMSAMSRQYAISSVAEARAYLAHPVLGPRLRECAQIVAGTAGRSARQVFGPVDAMKLRSSMTLFAAAEAGEADARDAGPNVFRAVLARFFDGVPDEETVARLLRPARRAGPPASRRPSLKKVFSPNGGGSRRPAPRHREMSCQRPPRHPKLAACPGPRRRPTAASSRPSRASARCSRRGWTSTARLCSPSAPA